VVRALWTIARVVLLLASLLTLLVTPLFVSSSTGTTSIETTGALTDAISVVLVIFVVWSLWRDRRALI